MAKLVVDISDIVAWNRLLAVEAVAIARRVEPAVAESADRVETRVHSDVPVGATGILKGSIRRTGRGLRQRVAAGGGRAYYGVFQEFGTRKMRANPFLITHANQATLAEFEARVRTAVFAGAIYRGEA